MFTFPGMYYLFCRIDSRKKLFSNLYQKGDKAILGTMSNTICNEFLLKLQRESHLLLRTVVIFTALKVRPILYFK